MDLLKLSKLCDSFKIYDSNSKEGYKETSNFLKDNFYAHLLYKMSIVLRTDKKFRETPLSKEINLRGDNKGVIEYDPNSGRIQLYVNGVKVYSDKIGNDNAVKAVLSTVSSELSGKVKIKRPKGRSIQKDRSELSPSFLDKNGLKFPRSVYDRMTKSESGERQDIVKRNYKSRQVLKPSDYNYLVENDLIESKDYNKEGDFYFSNKSRTFLVEGDYGSLINHLDEALAREPGMEEFYDESVKRKTNSFILYKDNLYKVDLSGVQRYTA